MRPRASPAFTPGSRHQTLCKSPAEDAELETVQVSQQPVQMLDTQHAFNTKLGTVLVPHQFVEMSHAPPVQDFASLATFTARALLEL
ncbi:hypothetical protein TNCV_3576901 [Trichonephila clavipes]|uniref:Uncharacterized protein n=1 Tax=Trichonephila clavipes TaxID=2585209 RepID=A0A8X6RJY6_TRICX|nr:hypothetical protein TNCV_3576901 [Trichonephila clavipes]